MSQETHERPVRSQEQFCTHEWFVSKQSTVIMQVKGQKQSKYNIPMQIVVMKCLHCHAVENITL